MHAWEFGAAETAVNSAVQWLRLLVETTGALIVAIGMTVALRELVRALLARKSGNFSAIRLILARYLALEFQLGADILSTAIAPTFPQIGKLGAIAVIRTALNYFLSREIAAERGAVLPPDVADAP